jgi:hypothetical protein
MIEEVRKRLSQLKEILRGNAASKVLPKPKTSEERRQEALEYLVEKHFEWKRREEEYRKKLERYGRIRRWIYTRSMSAKSVFVIIREVIVKPSIMTVMICSGFFSIWLGTTVGQQFSKFTLYHTPSPFNYVLDVLVLFPLGFSPGLISIVLTYYVEKRKIKKLLEDYGVTAQHF